MKKLFILNIIIFSLSTISIAQNQLLPEFEKDRIDIINKSTYIFEAVPLSYDTYDIAGKTYHSYIIEVKKVFRGNIKKGTIELIEGPSNGSPNHHGTILHQYRTFIIFGITSDYPVNPNPPSKTNNIVVRHYPSYEESVISVGYMGSDEYDVYGLAKSKFRSKLDFYNYLKTYPNITIPPDEPVVQKAQDASPTIPYRGVDSVEIKKS